MTINEPYMCDVCGKHEVEYFGRWVGYCQECKDNGKGPDRDRGLVVDNELSGSDIYDADGSLSDYIADNLL